MKSVLLSLIIAFLCSISFVAGSYTNAKTNAVVKNFAAHMSHETNELDTLQQGLAADK